MERIENEVALSELIRRGEVLRGIPGATPKEALTSLIHALRLPESLDRNALLQTVLERESLMPTSIGNGIALPHPRNPLISDQSEQFATLAFLEQPVDWQALDNVAVQTLLLIVTASPKMHLHILSRVHFLCRQDTFCDLLSGRASTPEIIEAVSAIERVWQ
jgi:PTS system nitrogen regulatory IIA component